ncbi:MOTHER of FT and TF 1-like isoform B [Micractinium conductrix]|uniref:MOTHER of FT and TF 1-like isoform B n=1 Tax=Micractinium conductrix TaxID=554055 RepID=A0A2P6VFI9_9CHLO|nr:MOTHER of FT and TF 1-like isoform B [Micractinium conductrix]|eukprot:PSC72839.1 MOTHER of FT and TF 1-like isoform B [Micractinium conductrix]
MCAALGCRAVGASLEQAKIIPDILDRVSAASQAQLVVEFQGKAVQHGELLTPAATKSAPVARVKGGAEGGLFTILCTDPDPPDPAAPKFREWLHWIVANVPSGGDSTQGQTVTPYRGPSPPIGTHRYVFMLFQQPNQEPLQLSDPSGGDPMARRASFSTRKFAAAHSLGDPVAVTWFNAHK